MRYKVTNILLPTEDGEEFKIVSVYNSFEEMSNKIVKDLNSLWNGLVPFPYEVKIEEATEDDKDGISVYQGGELMSNSQGNALGGELGKDVLEIYGQKIKERWNI